MEKIFAFLGALVGPDKVGGWVRAGVAAGLTALVGWVATKIPFVTEIVSPDMITAVSVAVGTAVAGLWSQIVKK